MFDFDKLTPKAKRAAFAHMATGSAASKVAKAAEPTKSLEPVQLAPPKPKRMSQKKYRELHDSEPHYVEAPGVRMKVAGLVSAQAIVNTYRRQGIEPTVRPVKAADKFKAAGKKS